MLPGFQDLPTSSLPSKAPIICKCITYLCGPNDNQEKVTSPTVFPPRTTRTANEDGTQALDTAQSKLFTGSSSFNPHHNPC